MTKATGIGVMLVAVAAPVAMTAGYGGSSGSKPSAFVPPTLADGAPNYASSSDWLVVPQATTKEVDVFFLSETTYLKATPSSPGIDPIDDLRMQQGAFP